MLKLALVFALLTGTITTQPGQAPQDFAVRIEFGCNGIDVLDTAKGTHERQMRRAPRQVATITIDEALKQRWFRLTKEADFSAISSKRLAGLAHCEPSTRNTMTVSGNGRRHTVRWESCGDQGLPQEFGVTNSEYRRIEALASAILKEVHAMPTVARLQPSDMFCL